MVVSVNIELRVAGPGNDAFAAEAWELKEHIRQNEGFLRQRRGFFMDAYRRSTAYLLIEDGPTEKLVSFCSVRRDGYILFLAVDADYRGEGYAERLIKTIAEEYGSVSCHARTTNEQALGFYKHVGFRVVREVTNYYEDGGAAYYLRLGNNSITSKFSEFMRR